MRRYNVSLLPPLPLLPLPRASLLPERPADHLRRHSLAPTLHLETGAWLCRRGGQIGATDGDAEGRAHRAAAHQIDVATLVEHRIAVPRKAAALELKAHQLPCDAPVLLCLE